MASGRRDPRTPAAPAAAPAADRHTLIVPGPDVPGGRTFLVNFPGYVRNEDRALATFGGADGLAAQRAAHPKALHLRLRPGDPACHPLVSDDARAASCLVLRLSRPAGSGNGAAADVDAELVAAADRAYSFTSPADYQYAGRDLRPEEVQWSARAGHAEECPPFLPPAPLLVTPPVWAVEGPLDYGFRQYKAGDRGVGVLGRRAKPRGPAPTWTDFLTPEVPAAADEGAWVGSAAGEGAAARLGELLRRRPVYLEGALAAALGGEGGAGGTAGSVSSTRAHLEALCALCYRFRNGPWQGAWVRRGYDPRIDPGARAYQVLSHAMPAEWWRQVAAAKEAGGGGRGRGRGGDGGGPPQREAPPPALPPMAPTYAALTAFAGVQATPLAALQLCDLNDGEVAVALTDPANVAPSVNEACGWLSQAAWEGVKSRVAARFEALWKAAAEAAAAGTEEGAGAAAAASGGAEPGEQPGILPEGLLTELTSYLQAEGGAPGAEGGAAAAAAEEEDEDSMEEEEGGVEEESEEEEEGGSGEEDDDDGE